MGQSDPPPTQPDPLLQQQEQQAHNDLIRSLGQQAQSDTASIMARYGTQLAMSGATGLNSPLVSSGAKV